MKPTKITQALLCGLALTLAASGCKKHPVGVTNLPGYGRTGNPSDLGPGSRLGADDTGSSGLKMASEGGIPSNPAGSHDGWAEQASILQADTVHFAFDSSVVRSEDQSKVAAVADYLKSNSGNAVKITGHCDERGTEEYNRSLGERRALALREALAALGVQPSRVDTVSFGKDRPADPGHDESAWKQNRRGEFIVLTPPGK
jgi:peptidoglycan-associated lipoprotein